MVMLSIQVSELRPCISELTTTALEVNPPVPVPFCLLGQPKFTPSASSFLYNIHNKMDAPAHR